MDVRKARGLPCHGNMLSYAKKDLENLEGVELRYFYIIGKLFAYSSGHCIERRNVNWLRKLLGEARIDHGFYFWVLSDSFGIAGWFLLGEKREY